MRDWPSKTKDLKIFYKYAELNCVSSSNSLFQIDLSSDGKSFQIQLVHWMQALILHYFDVYGLDQGEFVARKLMSYCLSQGQTLH